MKWNVSYIILEFTDLLYTLKYKPKIENRQYFPTATVTYRQHKVEK